MNYIKQYIIKRLKETIVKVESDDCDITPDIALDILTPIGREIKSREQAERYLRVSKATFTNYIRDGIIPEGTTHAGLKEKTWYVSDLDKAIIMLHK